MYVDEAIKLLKELKRSPAGSVILPHFSTTLSPPLEGGGDYFLNCHYHFLQPAAIQ